MAYLGWPTGSVVGDDRRAGWSAGCAAEPVAPGPEESCEQDLDSARRAARRLLRDLGPRDAVVCASDILALGMHHELLAAGRALGDDIGVVGFDGSENARMHHLTTVVQPLEQIADRVLTLLHDALAGRPPPLTGQLLEPVLHRSASTSSPPSPR